ncbi:formimidoylglutamase, partial [Acinetobacter calcoaceticus]
IIVDPHFDLPEAEHATSGTPFLQAPRLSEQHQKQFHFLCIGVANHANTTVLFDTADALYCSYLRDHVVNFFNLNYVLA